MFVVDVGALGLRPEIRRERGHIPDNVLAGGVFEPAEIATALRAHLVISPRVRPNTCAARDPSIVPPLLRPPDFRADMQQRPVAQGSTA